MGRSGGGEATGGVFWARGAGADHFSTAASGPTRAVSCPAWRALSWRGDEERRLEPVVFPVGADALRRCVPGSGGPRPSAAGAVRGGGRRPPPACEGRIFHPGAGSTCRARGRSAFRRPCRVGARISAPFRRWAFLPDSGTALPLSPNTGGVYAWKRWAGRRAHRPHFPQVVIRRLPPSLTKEQLEEQLRPLPAHDYFEFFTADSR